LKSGHNKGYQYKRVIREIDQTQSDIIDIRFESLVMNGFLNYIEVPGVGATSFLGPLMLKQQWKEAIDAILAHQSNDCAAAGAARQHWMRTNDARRSLAMFPPSCLAERAILSILRRKNASDYEGAFSAIPKALRLVYLHAFQVHFFNEDTDCRALCGIACSITE